MIKIQQARGILQTRSVRGVSSPFLRRPSLPLPCYPPRRPPFHKEKRKEIKEKVFLFQNYLPKSPARGGEGFGGKGVWGFTNYKLAVVTPYLFEPPFPLRKRDHRTSEARLE